MELKSVAFIYLFKIYSLITKMAYNYYQHISQSNYNFQMTY